MNDFQKDGVVSRLAQLDEDLFSLYGTSQMLEMTIVGGSALLIMDLTQNARYTTDIDVLSASPEVLGLLARYDINTDVSTFLYKYPEGWKKRRVRVPFDGLALNVYALSTEDLAITKLLSWRDIDKQDLLNLYTAKSIDLDKLKSILDEITELQINLDEKEWRTLLGRLEDFCKGEL